MKRLSLSVFLFLALTLQSFAADKYIMIPGNVTGPASDSHAGVVELATDAETVTGTSDAVVTTPGNITAKMSAPGAIGNTTPHDVTMTDQMFTAATELTISAGGEVTITKSVHKIDTAADGATDDLDTISGGQDEQILFIRAENAARTVVVKHGTGNILLAGDDVELDDTNKYLILMYDSLLSKWLVAGGSGSGALSTKDVTTPAYKLFIASDSDGTILDADRTVTIDTSNTSPNLDIPADQQFPATAGTVEASHVLSADANRDLATLRNLTLDGTLTVPGYLESEADSGAVVLYDMPVSDTPAAATEESASFRIDATTLLKLYAEADSAGGIQNPRVVIEVSLQHSREPITATSEGVAADLDVSVTEITTNGDEDLDNVTLADGTIGQEKIFIIKAVGHVNDSVKITPATMAGGSIITFAASPLGLGCHMIFTSAGWVVSANNGGTIS